jgi:hypothetical protein
MIEVILDDDPTSLAISDVTGLGIEEFNRFKCT